MIIRFNNIDIQSFKSLGQATVNLDGRGIVKVQGCNNYESNAESNGSGKSSIFSALFWGLFGKTPEGIANPANRYTSEKCQVIISLRVDNDTYEIVREIRKSSQYVIVKCNGSEVSCRNRTDSDKYIKESILRMTPDIFLSLVYLNQGFSSRLSLLTPSARKERLELIINISDMVNDFSNRLMKVSDNYSTELKSLESCYYNAIGKQESYNSLSEECKAKIDDYQSSLQGYEFEGRIYTVEDKPLLQEAMRKSSDAISSIMTEKSDLLSKLSTEQRNSDTLVSSKRSAQSRKADASTQLNSVNTGCCPTCHQLLPTNISEELQNTLQRVIDESSDVISKCDQDISLSQDRINSLLRDKASIESRLNAIQQKYSKQNTVFSNIPDVDKVNVDKLLQDSKDYADRANQLNSYIEEVNKEISKKNYDIAIVSHCRQLVTKSFRGYLLQNAVDYLNSRLAYYSKFLFCNKHDVVSVVADSQKLDIMLGDAPYDTLSGGEQRRVDIPIMLAQRDLAAEVAGVSCNILILDEIMESMDEVATQVTLDLLERQSDNVESLFIISHNDYSLPVDSTIRVVKGVDRIATVYDE